MTTSARTWLIDIGSEACTELIASSAVGRLAVIVEGHPEIYPVNHVLDPATGTVAFPTRAGTKLRAALSWPTVAFEVDGTDPDGASWSVLVVGRAELVGEECVPRLAARRTTLWAAGAGTRWVRVVPNAITGRRIFSD